MDKFLTLVRLPYSPRVMDGFKWCTIKNIIDGRGSTAGQNDRPSQRRTRRTEGKNFNLMDVGPCWFMTGGQEWTTGRINRPPHGRIRTTVRGYSSQIDERRDGPLKIFKCGQRSTARQIDEVHPWMPGLNSVYHNLFFSVLDNLTFISINSLER